MSSKTLFYAIDLFRSTFPYSLKEEKQTEKTSKQEETVIFFREQRESQQKAFILSKLTFLKLFFIFLREKAQQKEWIEQEI